MANLQDVKKWLKDAKNYDYSWNQATGGDDPTKITLDKTRLNRSEGYEIALFIYRVLEDNNWKISEDNTLLIEKCIHKTCTGQSREKVAECIATYYRK